MKWNYTVSNATIWTSFDSGKVEADTYDEAVHKATEELNADFDKANAALKNINPHFEIQFEPSQVQVTPIQQKEYRLTFLTRVNAYQDSTEKEIVAQALRELTEKDLWELNEVS